MGAGSLRGGYTGIVGEMVHWVTVRSGSLGHCEGCVTGSLVHGEGGMAGSSYIHADLSYTKVGT